jgi:cobalt-zinc-cadmium resistance protein CzcA
MAETIKQLQHVKLAKQVSLAQFQILLGTAQIYVPDEGSIRIALSEELAVENNPHLIKFETQQRVSAAKLQTERMRFMPELLVAYQNMSITGVGNDDRFYPKSARFQSVQLGVGMPLFFGSNLARTKALQLELKASEMQAMYARKQWMQQRDNLRKQIFALDTICRYYENGVLIEAAKAQDAAWQQYQQGGINFMEWMMLYNQAIQTNIAYLDVVQQLNQYIIQYQNFQSIIK